MFKRNWHWALVVLIILGIGSFLIFRPKTQVGTIKIYKTHETATLGVKPIQTGTSERINSTNVRAQSVSDTGDIAPSVPGAIDTRSMVETASSEVAPETGEVSEDTTATAGEAEELHYGDYTKEELAQIKEWGEDLRDRLLIEYADLRELADMTPEQIAEKYPTDEDQHRLAERGKKFFEEYLEETRALLVSLPEPVRKKAFEQIHSELAKSWGREANDSKINDARSLAYESDFISSSYCFLCVSFISRAICRGLC